MSEIKELKNIPEISFIDNRTLEDIRNEMQADYMAKYQELTGKAVVLTDADPVRLVMLAAAAQIYQAMQYVDRSGKQDLLKYSYGGFLDNIGALKKLTRRPAAYATATMLFSMTNARGEATAIPGGTRVATESGLYFMTDAYAEIPAGEESAEVQATAMEAGKAGNALPEGSITKIVDPLPYIAKVRNITESAGGADVESDDDFTERIYHAPAGYSVAGPSEAYEYHARNFRPDVDDVKAYTPEPCVVRVLFLLEGGKLPTEEDCAAMAEYLSKDTLRPLTDQVFAAAPRETEYSISLKYFINRSDAAQAAVIQQEVGQAISSYKMWQRTLGRDVNPSELIKRVISAGAKRVELIEPMFCQIDESGIAALAAETIVYGGLEDD